VIITEINGKFGKPEKSIFRVFINLFMAYKGGASDLHIEK